MNIRLARTKDKENIYSLWQDVFGDTKETVDLFFKYCYKNENTLVCDDGGEVVSMLFLIEADISLHSSDEKSYYIYSAATRRDYRKRGIMTKLLNFADEVAKSRDVSFLFLHPADEDLYLYYGERGFFTCFYRSRHEIKTPLLKSVDISSCNYVKWSDGAKRLNTFFLDNDIPFFAFLPLDKNDTEKTGMIKAVGKKSVAADEIIYMGFTLE